MKDKTSPFSRLPVRLALVLLLAGLATGLAVACLRLLRPEPSTAEARGVAVAETDGPEARPEQVRAFCGACHAYPPPDTFPRAAWHEEVLQGYHFGEQAGMLRAAPDLRSVVRYYEHRAPESLVIAPEPSVPGPPPVRFEKTALTPPGNELRSVISHLTLAPLSDPRRPDLLACDMFTSRVLALNPAEAAPRWRTLAQVPYPDHAEVVDLDGDGIKDVIVACLGRFSPGDDKVGRVVWLRGKRDGTFTPVTLLEGVGRVADVQAADFNGDGRLDLIVAAFGWRTTGEIILLENQTTDWEHPRFVPRVLDKRHGAIHVPVADLNGDGRPDFVALISQEHETVVAFLNDGKGGFEEKPIFTASHPAYGSSGIQLVDLNGDGKLDVLYTNGDILDPPYLLKPYHTVQWLENPGDGTYPWKHHHLATMPGVMRALAADIDGDGDQDIVAVSYLPPQEFPQRERLHLDSVVLLEQTAPGKFVRHSLEQGTCDHLTFAVGDWEGSGRPGLVVGNGSLQPNAPPMDAVTVWKNLGAAGTPGRGKR